MLLSKGCIAFCKTCTVYAPKFVEIVKSRFCFFPVFIVLFDYFSCGWLENQNGCWQMSGHSWKTTCRQKVRCGGTGEGRPHNCVVEISPGIVAILKFTIWDFVVSDFHSFFLTRGKYRTSGRIESFRMKIPIEPKGLFVDPPLNHHTKVTKSHFILVQCF